MLWLLPLAACATPQAVVVRQEVPPAMLACQAAPPPPPPTADDQALALWLVDMAASGEDCRNRLRHVKELLDGR